MPVDCAEHEQRGGEASPADTAVASRSSLPVKDGQHAGAGAQPLQREA